MFFHENNDSCRLHRMTPSILRCSTSDNLTCLIFLNISCTWVELEREEKGGGGRKRSRRRRKGFAFKCLVDSVLLTMHRRQDGNTASQIHGDANDANENEMLYKYRA